MNEELDPENIGWNTHGAFEDKYGMSQEKYQKKVAAGKRPPTLRPDIKLALDDMAKELGLVPGPETEAIITSLLKKERERV